MQVSLTASQWYTSASPPPAAATRVQVPVVPCLEPPQQQPHLALTAATAAAPALPTPAQVLVQGGPHGEAAVAAVQQRRRQCQHSATATRNVRRRTRCRGYSGSCDCQQQRVRARSATVVDMPPAPHAAQSCAGGDVPAIDLSASQHTGSSTDLTLLAGGGRTARAGE